MHPRANYVQCRAGQACLHPCRILLRVLPGALNTWHWMRLPQAQDQSARAVLFLPWRLRVLRSRDMTLFFRLTGRRAVIAHVESVQWFSDLEDAEPVVGLAGADVRLVLGANGGLVCHQERCRACARAVVSPAGRRGAGCQHHRSEPVGLSRRTCGVLVWPRGTQHVDLDNQSIAKRGARRRLCCRALQAMQMLHLCPRHSSHNALSAADGGHRWWRVVASSCIVAL